MIERFPAEASITEPNRLLIRLQPEEGMRLEMMTKEPGPGGLHLRVRLRYAGVLRYVAGTGLRVHQIGFGRFKIGQRLLVIGLGLRQRYVVLLRVDGQ